MIIFRGQEKKFFHEEQDSWDVRAHVGFKKNCDELMMKKWISEQWGNIFIDPTAPGLTGKILLTDMYQAQQTNDVKVLLEKKKTELVNVRPGCTSRIQPLDICLF